MIHSIIYKVILVLVGALSVLAEEQDTCPICPKNCGDEPPCCLINGEPLECYFNEIKNECRCRNTCPSCPHNCGDGPAPCCLINGEPLECYFNEMKNECRCRNTCPTCPKYCGNETHPCCANGNQECYFNEDEDRCQCRESEASQLDKSGNIEDGRAMREHSPPASAPVVRASVAVSLHLAKAVCKQHFAYQETNLLQKPIKSRKESGSMYGCGWFIKNKGNGRYQAQSCEAVGLQNTGLK